MKKIIFLLLVSIGLFAASSKAQTGQLSLLSQYGNATDTVVNTGAKSLVTAVKGYMKTIGITATITSVSGTLGGTAVLQGSTDGVNYYPVVLANSQSNSFTITNVASQGVAWYIIDSPFQYYRVLFTGSGTMQAIVQSTLVSRTLR